MHEDRERCLRAVAARDPRFDGWFVGAVTSTGIYCRPSCPALNPKPANLRFFPGAAAAQAAGFRACKRCRPDAAPGSPEWDRRADLAGRAMRLIADGVVDRSGVDGLAVALGYERRQVERTLRAELGAGPLALARARRAQTARLLVETTALPMTEVSAAAGFASLRQFNDTVRSVFDLTPTQLRARATGRPTDGAGTAGGAVAGSIDLRLPFRAPLYPAQLFGHLAATAVPGVEEWRDGRYRRTVSLPRGPGIVELAPRADHVAARLRLADLRDLAAAITRCRRLLDLDADPVAVDACLAGDPALAPLVAAAPGRRVPRTVDEAEFAVRTVLGQQVSTAAARTHAARLVAVHGRPIADPAGGLTHLFPDPGTLAGIDPSTLRLPETRRRTLITLSAELAGGLDLGAGTDQAAARASLAALPGIGPWTVEMIALRALGDPDAFPAGDLGLLAAAGRLGLPAAARPLTAAAARWRPWRSYAVQHLWGTLDHAVNRMPPDLEETST